MNVELTVLLYTYNHKNYFRKSIESVLSQKTNFNFIIHIFDDASNDGTSDIVREYAEKYPDKIFANINKTNIGFKRNILNAILSVKTKYFATLESDDYWCDDNKLQKQFDVLENNQDCSFCGHNTKIYDCKKQEFGDNLFNIETRKIQLTKNFKIKKDFIKVHPSSRMYRTNCINLETIKNKEMLIWDSTSFWYFLSKGNLYYINEVMSVYNYTHEGIFTKSKVSKKYQMAASNVVNINKELDYKYNYIFLDLFKKLVHVNKLEYVFARYFLNNKKLNKFYQKKLENLYEIKYFMANGYNNFGDNLNKFIIEKLTNDECISTNERRANTIAIGSILDQFFFMDKKKKFNKKPIKVWGSGFISDFETIRNYNPNLIEKFNRNMEIYALRGKLSKERCEKILDRKLENVVLGDPGLLVSMFTENHNDKKYDVGIIPHYKDKDSEYLKNIKLQNLTYKILDITQDVPEMLTEIMECRCIISSAMHGLIASDALNIPNKWIKLSDDVFGNGYKFKDYYSVFDIDNPSPIDLTKETIDDNKISEIIANYPINHSKVVEIQNRLIERFPWKK